MLKNLEQRYLQRYITQKDLPEMTIQGAPIDKIDSWRPLVDMDAFAPIVVFSIIIVSASLIVYPLVEEKQDGIREILSIATSHSYVNQLSLYITNVLILLVIVVVDMVLLSSFDCLKDVSVIHPILLSIALIFSIVSFSFFISVFFETGEFFLKIFFQFLKFFCITVTYATIGSFLFFSIPVIVFNYVLEDGPFLKLQVISPGSMYLRGMDIIEHFMSAQRPFVWSSVNISEHPVRSGYSMAQCYYSLIGATLIYYFLYYYLSNVFPGSRGTPRPFYFLFTVSTTIV